MSYTCTVVETLDVSVWVKAPVGVKGGSQEGLRRLASVMQTPVGGGRGQLARPAAAVLTDEFVVEGSC